MKVTDDGYIGYLAHYLSPQKGYFGGLLVTDTKGNPKEFRHTEGIKPSKIQTILYGDSLEASIGTDAIAPALYQKIKTEIDVLLISKQGQSLFGRFAFMNPPAAMLSAEDDPDKNLPDLLTPEGNLLAGIGFESKGKPNQHLFLYIESDLDSEGPLRILKAAEKRTNLYSPFDRILKVLEEIANAQK